VNAIEIVKLINEAHSKQVVLIKLLTHSLRLPTVSTVICYLLAWCVERICLNIKMVIEYLGLVNYLKKESSRL
jgi:hypothetical protein